MTERIEGGGKERSTHFWGNNHLISTGRGGSNWGKKSCYSLGVAVNVQSERQAQGRGVGEGVVPIGAGIRKGLEN